ncbi:MAG: flotillin family protein, partial [Prochlorococcus sp.]|nr:flotillin family protein [Prochlorococcus sp.]
MIGLIASVSLVTFAAGSALALVLKNLYYICQPSEVLIFAGRRTVTGSGETVGYRLVKGGSSIRVPVMEEVMRMDLSNMIIDLKVDNAYSKGGVPLNVTGVAN